MAIFFAAFALLLIILVGGQAFIGLSLVKFFPGALEAHKFLLIGILLALALSFVVSSALLHWWQGPVIKVAYYISSIWIGVAIDLILAFCLGWLIIFIAGYFGWKINLAALGSFLIILSLSWSAYGVWNANQIKVRTIEVEMPNLPEDWKGKTAVQISDTHLGAINGAPFLEKIVRLTKEQSPDIIFITGDLFDGTGRDLNGLALPLKNLKAPLGIYFITGNHEIYSGADKVKEALSLLPIIILEDQVIDINGVQLAGISYPGQGVGMKKDVAPVLAKLDPSKPSIVLYHEPIPSLVEKIKKAGVNLLLTGHTHRGQIFPANFFSWLIYRDYFYGVYKDGSFTLCTTSGAGTWGPPMRDSGPPEIVKIIFK